MNATELKRKINRLATLIPAGFQGNELANVEYQLSLLEQAVTQAVDRATYREARDAQRQEVAKHFLRKKKAFNEKQRKIEKERELQEEIDKTAPVKADVKIKE